MYAANWRVLRGVFFACVAAAATGAALQIWLARADQRMYQPPGRLIEVRDSLMHLRCEGDGGPTLVIDAGAGQWSIHWSHLLAPLAASGRACLYDRAGFGWSGDAAPATTLGELSADLRDTLRAARESGPFVLAGHSLGGYVVRHYQTRYPRETAAIILVDAAHEDQFVRLPELEIAVRRARAPLHVAGALAAIGLFRLVEPPEDLRLPNVTDQFSYRATLRNAGYWHSLARTISSGPDYADEVPSTADGLGDLPLLVITAGASVKSYCGDLALDCAGTQEVWNSLQAALSELSIQSQQVTCPQATHNIQIDDPACVARAITSFRRQISHDYSAMPEIETLAEP